MAVKAQFIAGQWLPGSGATMSKLAPEDQSLLWQAASAGADDVQAACAAARAAFYPWSHRPLAERIDVVQRFAALLETHKEALATLISRETSKPLWETRTEVQAMIGKAAISIEAYHQRTGFHESTLPDGKALLRHKPHGVMAVFGPYNFPGHLPNGHIIPALIAGNTIVFKPSELTPATAEMTVQLWQQAGIPDGAINLLQGGKATGQALLENRDIDGVLFTGSAAAGFHFHRYFGGQPEKMLALEMGGNNALIVADVADIDAALHVIIQSAFISAGQRCTCARRLIVPRGEQGDALLQRLVEASAQIRAGKWDDQPAPFMGGVISLDAAQNMLAAQQKLEGLGGKVLLRMRQPDPRSTVLTPGIVDVTGIEVPDEEYFGPLLTIIRYDGFPEAIRLANQTRYGLAVGLISSDAAQFDQLADEARAGIVMHNDLNRLFGGRHLAVTPGNESRRAFALEQAVQAFYRAADAAGPVNRGHLDMHTAIRGSLYRQFALLPAHAGDFSPDFYQLLQASGMDAVVRHTEAGGTFTHFTCEKFAAQSATLELGKVMPFGANDLSLFAAADAAIRAWIADAPLPPRDKAPVDYFLVEESIIKREGEFTLNLAADVENFTALPAGYEIARQAEKRWVVQARAPYILFPNAGVATGQRAGLLLRAAALRLPQPA
ncbi:succinylglutamate-semialdehyde dehydrogenase [Klebsiella pneumoniae]